MHFNTIHITELAIALFKMLGDTVPNYIISRY